jgi:hypothetical protein
LGYLFLSPSFISYRLPCLRSSKELGPPLADCYKSDYTITSTMSSNEGSILDLRLRQVSRCQWLHGTYADIGQIQIPLMFCYGKVALRVKA